MKMIKQGSEAKLFLVKKNNQNVVIKERIKKKYRIKQIDERIRKLRTSKESNLLRSSRRVGVLTPKILEIDKKNHQITMEFIDGKIIKKLLNESNKKNIEKICFEIGKSIGKLHNNGIIHGDLTTSNMIYKDEKIYFIDFGLGFHSKKIEDQGTDLKLLHEAFKSTHFKILDICWKNVIRGYRKEFKDVVKVLKKVDDIERRGRYIKRND